MGSRAYEINRKVKVKLEIEVDVTTLYEWRGTLVTDEQLQDYVKTTLPSEIAEHLAGDLIQEHILEQGHYDSVYFNVEWSKIKHEGQLI